MCHVSCVMCHMSCCAMVMCHVSCVMCVMCLRFQVLYVMFLASRCAMVKQSGLNLVESLLAPVALL